jgi:hypothetical protein
MDEFFKNKGKRWTSQDLIDLKKHAFKNRPLKTISEKLGRTNSSILKKAKEYNIRINF